MRKIILLFSLLQMVLSVYSQQDSLLERAIAYAEGFDYQKSNPLFTALLKNELSPNQQGTAHYYLMRGLWHDNKFDLSLAHGDSALSAFDAIDNHEMQGHTYYVLCMQNLIAGSYDVSLLQSQLSMDEFALVPDTAMMIKAKARRGIVFHDIGDYDEGIRTCNEALELYEEYSGKNPDILAMIYGITAINYDDRGDSDVAVTYYEKILSFQDKLSNSREITRTYNNMGNSLMKLGELTQAKKYFMLNLAANEKAQFSYGIATVKTNLGTVAYQQNDFTTAEKYLNEAEKISYEIRDAEKILDVLQQQHYFHELIGDPTTSLSYLKKYHHLKDSLYDLDKQRQIALLEKKYETDKKEQQIKLQTAELAEQKVINQRNTAVISGLVSILILIVTIYLLSRSRIRKKQALLLQEAQTLLREKQIEAAISSQEKERSRVAKDLHDGFGQMISILNLNLKSLEMGEKDKHEVFENSSKVLEEMYRELKGICFNLMPQTLIKHGISAALQEFAARINLTDQLSVETDFFGLDERLTDVQELSLYRISQEWVNNVIKYSDADRITIQITRDDAEVTLLIEDNGSGFDPNLLKQGNGNGWKNMNSRANLINGELELDTTVGVKGNTLIVNATLEQVVVMV